MSSSALVGNHFGVVPKRIWCVSNPLRACAPCARPGADAVCASSGGGLDIAEPRHGTWVGLCGLWLCLTRRLRQRARPVWRDCAALK